MSEREMKNAPPLYGWAIAAGAGAVAFGVSLALVGIEGNGSVFIGIVVALVVGIIFTVAERGAAPPKPAGTAPTASAGGPSASAATSSPAPQPEEPAAAAPAASAAASASTSATVAAEATAPSKAEAVSGSGSEEGSQPEALDAPVGEKDDLKQISGVGPVLEGKLNELGIYHFWQIARWSSDEVNWVDGFLNFKGRIERDDWIGQAKALAEKSPSKAPN